MILDYKFKPRPYQIPFLKAFDSGFKRLYWIIHRRGGKDLTLWNLVIAEAVSKKGLYYYFFPTYTQAKKVIWEGITNDGDRFLDFIPKELIESTSASELKITLKSGSIIRLIGSDQYDAVRGSNPIGCVFSEFAYQAPMAWEVVAPILRANDGWAVFQSTPNGKNFAFRLWEKVRDLKHWWTELLTIDDTGVLTEADIDEERAEGRDEVILQQEYWCNFSAGALGAYYVDFVNSAREENRICKVHYDRLKTVDVFFDLGRNDKTSILFVQTKGEEIRIIDSYENHSVEFAHYIQFLRDTGYQIRYLWLPHDGYHKRVEAKLSCAGQAEEAGFNVRQVPNIPIESGINLVRKLFPRLWFDEENCSILIDALEDYKKEYDEKRKDFKNHPYHSWSSHMADCCRYMAVVMEGTSLDTGREVESAGRRYLHEAILIERNDPLDLLDQQLDNVRIAEIEYLNSINGR